MTTLTPLDTEFKRGLGLYASTMVVIGSMIGSGIFLVSAEMGRQTASPGLLLTAWIVTGVPHARRRALVRRARGDDAARRRSVRVPARSVRATLGVPLRLDALHGDPDRHDCGGGGRLRPLHRISAAVVLRRALPHPSTPSLAWLCGVAVNGAAARHRHGRAADVDQHARPRLGQAHSERLHDDQDRCASRADCRRPAFGSSSAATSGNLGRPVDAARRDAARARARRHDNLRRVHRPVRGAGGIALLRRCVEQHHVHRR